MEPVLTFTEAAANERRGRIADAIRKTARQIGSDGGHQTHWLRRQAANTTALVVFG